MESPQPTLIPPPEPSWREVFLLVVLVFTLHILLVSRVASFWYVASGWYDNPWYLQLAATISNWRLPGGEIAHHFWGFPFSIAVASKVFSMPPLGALVMISMLSSLAVCLLVRRLYGGWVALALYSFINYRWIYTSVEGGSEPLFMCLVFAAFLAARSDRWNLAALLAALGTTVRPVGIVALAGLAITLLVRRSYRRLAVITLIGLGIGVAYVVPVWIILGSPFANFTLYREDWGPQGWPLTYPFGALIPSFLGLLHARWPNVALAAIWLVAAIAGVVVMWLPRNRRRLSPDQGEAWFASIYTLFYLCYNYADVFGDLPRFLMPIAPLLLFSLRDSIPRDRRVLWPAALLAAVLASAAMVGFKNVLGFRVP